MRSDAGSKELPFQAESEKDGHSFTQKKTISHVSKMPNLAQKSVLGLFRCNHLNAALYLMENNVMMWECNFTSADVSKLKLSVSA